MSFDLDGLTAAVAAHGRVARVLIVQNAGSVPREAGTAMLVWQDGQSGTIGGGALEFDAVRAARDALRSGVGHLRSQALGPALAQCCGGAVTLLTELWDKDALAQISVVASRPLPGTTGPQPFRVSRAVADLRNGQGPASPVIRDGWIVERLSAPQQPIWIYGAGHVGRALVDVLAPLPDYAITWVDTDLDRFPDTVPDGVTVLPAANPADVVPLAPADARHFILTYSHALDLDLCHRLLSHGFAFAGLIGSATKWARFRKRLTQLGHSDAQISRITCPIGDPSLGKHPQAIAVGVVSGLLSQQVPKKAARVAGD